MLKLEAGDLRLQENIHRVCKTACSSESVIVVYHGSVAYRLISFVDGNRDEFLDRLVSGRPFVL